MEFRHNNAVVQTNSIPVLCARDTDFQLEVWLIWFKFLRGFHQVLQRNVRILSRIHHEKFSTYFYKSASHYTHDSGVVWQTAKKEAVPSPENTLPLCLTSSRYTTQILYNFCAYNILMEFASSTLILPLLRPANFKKLKYSNSKFSQNTTNLLSIINVATCFDL
jgi:hypothetical protein